MVIGALVLLAPELIRLVVGQVSVKVIALVCGVERHDSEEKVEEDDTCVEDIQGIAKVSFRHAGITKVFLNFWG